MTHPHGPDLPVQLSECVDVLDELLPTHVAERFEGVCGGGCDGGEGERIDEVIKAW